jgi:Raf kinase inhibitor-like YbhB/YbcL family protein
MTGEPIAISRGNPAVSIVIRSPAFDEGEPIPTRHTGDGEDLSPPLTWTAPPKGTVELALLVDDPDAPVAEPWVHWVLFRIPASAKGLPEGFHGPTIPPEPAGIVQGVNSWNSLGYRGPAPPRGHGTHHYHFKLYALDAALEFGPGIDKKGLLDAMSGHVVARAELVGTYQR